MSKEIILVLGMRRSATSLTTNILIELGLYAGMNNELLEADTHNKRGYFERKDIIELNNRILIENGMTWTSIRKKIEELKTNESVQKELKTILQSLEKNSADKNIVIKEPKMCIVGPVWRKALMSLNFKEKIIVVFRQPYEVAISLEKRDEIHFSYALKLWYYYNCCILHTLCSLHKSDYIIINHNDYFYKGELQIAKIVKFLDIKFNDSKMNKIIDVNLYHNKVNRLQYEGGGILEHMVDDLYNYMVSLSNGTKELDNNEIKKYMSYLNELDSSFEKNKLDIELNMVEESNYYKAKEWCYYILNNYKDIIKTYISEYFKKNNIDSISIYGNGIIAHMIFPILLDNDIKINNVYDKQNNETIIYGKHIIKVCNIEESDNNPKEIIINTVVNKNKEIVNMLYACSKQYTIISLFKILYEIIMQTVE